MSAQDPQVVDSSEFIPLVDYHFLGDDVTVRNKRAVIENLRIKAAVYVAAHAAGVSKMTVYRWRAIDEQFAQAMAEAMEDAKEIMESSVYEDALNGNTLLKMFWLKRHDPSYRDKVTVDIDNLREEIQEKIGKVGVEGLRQLPTAMTQFIDTETVLGRSESAQLVQFSLPSDNSQKEE